jgi:hypothetical protein
MHAHQRAGTGGGRRHSPLVLNSYHGLARLQLMVVKLEWAKWGESKVRAMPAFTIRDDCWGIKHDGFLDHVRTLGRIGNWRSDWRGALVAV